MFIVKNTRKTAAELYQVQACYQRFDQKNDMTRQAHWNPEVSEMNKRQNEKLERLLQRGSNSGYRLVDWAFYVGASGNLANTGFAISWPNRKGNSWQPLSKQASLNALLPAAKSYGKSDANPATHNKLVKKMGQQFGADEVGFTLLDRRWVYSHWFDEETKDHYPIRFSDEPGYGAYQEPTQLEDRTQVIPASMKYAIVLLHEMDDAGFATAPTLTHTATTLTAYSKISFTLVMLAEFIRALGYNAIPSANDTAVSIPLAIDAGLGELGRNGKLINPRFGPRCRISKIITDLPISVGYVKPWGVTEFCSVCKKCARSCPAGAIPMGERSFEPAGVFSQSGVYVWQIDHKKCYKCWERFGAGCGICIRVCPFNKSKQWFHNLAREAVKLKNRNVDSFMTRMDDALGYGKFRNKFWAI